MQVPFHFYFLHAVVGFLGIGAVDITIDDGKRNPGVGSLVDFQSGDDVQLADSAIVQKIHLEGLRIGQVQIINGKGIDYNIVRATALQGNAVYFYDDLFQILRQGIGKPQGERRWLIVVIAAIAVEAAAAAGQGVGNRCQ